MQEKCLDGNMYLNVGVSPVLFYVEALENYTCDSQDGQCKVAIGQLVELPLGGRNEGALLWIRGIGLRLRGLGLGLLRDLLDK